MSQRPSPLAIGSFIVGVAALLLVTVLFFSDRNLWRDSDRYVLFFEESLNGLKVGAPVSLKGVQVGEVTAIKLSLAEDNRVYTPVFIKVSPEAFTNGRGDSTEALREAMLERGLRAQLKMQSLLTGLLYIEFDFHPDKPPRYTGLMPDHNELPTIPTPLTELQNTLDELRLNELINSARKAVVGIEQLVNGPELQGAVTEFHESMQRLNRVLATLEEQAPPITAELESSLREIRTLGERLNRDWPALNDQLSTVLTNAAATADALDAAAADLAHTVSEDSALYDEALTAMEELTRAARSLRTLTETLDRQPESLLRGKRAPEE